jgi:hypothetical protein
MIIYNVLQLWKEEIMKDLLFLRKRKLKGQQKQLAKLNGQWKREWDLAKSEKSWANISTTTKIRRARKKRGGGGKTG